MSELFELMWIPLLTCVVLTGMHVYLGLHVVKRGVIFVDLALAQLAACGSTLGFLMGWGLHSAQGYICALAFTFLGSMVFALTRFKRQVVPQEALIGVVYAVAAATSIIVLSQFPEGGEELKSLMVGHLLLVSWNELKVTALIYASIGILHWVFRHQMLLISENPELAIERGVRVRFWDFIFYATFGVVVTSSTEIAGVLLVFSFLVVPAICGVLLSDSVRGRLLVGWSCGLITSVCGVAGSYYFDLPTGAAIVCLFGVCVMVCGCLIRPLLAEH